MQDQEDRIGTRKRKLEGGSTNAALWNVPDCILLDPSRPLTVGRTSLADVTLHSSKHPSMLSRRHARLQFDTTCQQWTITDLESLNGVYLNGKTRIQRSEPTTLEAGTQICFGTLIPQNELKYRLVRDDSGLCMLLRVGAKLPKEETDKTSAVLEIREAVETSDRDTKLAVCKDTTPPPAVEGERQSRVISPLEAQEPSDKKPRLEQQTSSSSSSSSSSVETVCASETESVPLSSEPKPEEQHLEKASNESSGSREQSGSQAESSGPSSGPETTLSAAHPQDDSASRQTVLPSTTTTPHTAPPAPSSTTHHTAPPANSAATPQIGPFPTSTTTPTQQQVSPGSNLVTPASAIDDLFSDAAAEKCLDDVVYDAMFGEEENVLCTQSGMVASGSSGEGGASGDATSHVDGTSLQIQAAKDEMQREKQKLLGSIEALRSELASKERLLVEKSEKEKEIEETKKQNLGVIDSMQEELTCVICQELFVVAHTLTCAHSFCKDCINSWMNSKKDCPICRKPIGTKPVHSLVLDNAIDKMVEKMDAPAREERKKLKELRAPKPAKSKSGVMDMLAAASALGVLSSSSTTSGSGPSGSGTNQGGAAGGSSSGSGGGGGTNQVGSSSSGGGVGTSQSTSSGSSGTSGSGGVRRRGRHGGQYRSGSGSGGSGNGGRGDRGGGSSGNSGRGATSDVQMMLQMVSQYCRRHSGSANNPIDLTVTPQPHRGRPSHSTAYEEDDEEVDEEDEEDEEDFDLDEYDSEESASYDDPGLGGHYYGGYGRCFNCGGRGHWVNGCPF